MTPRQFNPSKLIWTEDDFEQMSWHDCRLHGVGIIDDFNPHRHELRLDIDYIFRWSGHEDSSEPAGFWISPATLVFEAGRFRIDWADTGGNWIIALEHRAEASAGLCEWVVRLNTGGSISVFADGFRQYIRKRPIFLAAPDQSLETSQRGVISFETSAYCD